MTSPAAAKCILILLDGLSDRVHTSLDNRTPLQAASTPAMDSVAARGCNGLWHALSPGVALPSEAAHYFMMGYGPGYFPGRAYLEALGFGMEFSQEDVLALARLAVTRPSGGRLDIIQRKPPLPKADGEELARAVENFSSPQGRVRYVYTGKGQGIIIMSHNMTLSPRVSDSDPMADGMPVLTPVPWESDRQNPAAQHACRLLIGYLTWAHKVLSGHPINARRAAEGLEPVNCLITQRAGAYRPAPPVLEMWGLRVLSVSSHPLYRGIFMALGADAVQMEHQGDPAEELAGKVGQALDMIDDYDFIHVHSKAPDDAAHRGDARGKRDVIEALDHGLARVMPLLERRDDLLLMITGDHSTPSGGAMIHSGEPSPLVMAGPGQWRDNVSAFDEVSCAGGSLGLLRGRELMQTVLSGLDRGRLWGLRDTHRHLPYFPGPGRPLDFSTGGHGDR